MRINARLLTLLISEEFEVTEFGRDLETEELSLPVFYKPGMEVQAGQIYIARPQDIPPSSKAECIFICAGGRPAHVWNSRLGKLLVITERSLDLLTLFNKIQNIFNRISNWMIKMHELTIENAEIEKFVSASIPVFENCITITDYNLRVLVNSDVTEKDGRRRIAIDQQFERIPDEVTLTFRKDFIPNIMRREPFKYTGQRENPQGENYCINLYFGDSYIGTCTLWEKLRPLRESDLLLFQQFASFIRRALSSQTRTSEQGIVSIRTIFYDLLQCFPVSDRELKQAMTMLQVNMDSQEVSFGSWCCIVICSANKDKTLPEQYLCASVENLLPRCSALFFDDLLVCFCMIPKETASGDTIEECLTPYLQDRNFRAGISYPFTNIYDARYYYLQAKAMLETGCSMLPGQLIYSCDNCLLTYMVQHCAGEFLPDLMFSPGLKALQNADNGVDLWDTLRRYLDNECNTSHTAQELYLHRTSLQSRLEKIKSFVSLDTPEERLYLRICMKLSEK